MVSTLKLTQEGLKEVSECHIVVHGMRSEL